MQRQPRFLTTIDRRRLGTVLQNVHEHGTGLRAHVHALEDTLEHAHGIDPTEIPHDVVTMNSTVELRDLESNDIEIYTLAYPADADIRKDRISVLAPGGTAILGSAIGDVVKIKAPSGNRHVRVEAIHFQPERAGEFGL